MNIKKLFEKTSTGFKEFVAKVEFANVIGLSEELDKYIKKGSTNTSFILDNGERSGAIIDIDDELEYDEEGVFVSFISSDDENPNMGFRINSATESNAGLMSAANKREFEGLKNIVSKGLIKDIANVTEQDNTITVVYETTASKQGLNSFTINSATEEHAGLMSKDDKILFDKYINNNVNVSKVIYTNEEDDRYSASIGYEGITYKSPTINVNFTTYDDFKIESENVNINNNEISLTRGANVAKINKDGLLIDYTSTDSADTSYKRVNIGTSNIKYKYFIDNSNEDKENESGDFTYSFPKSSGTFLVDTENEANTKFINSDKSKTLTIGYDGISYDAKTTGTDANTNLFNVTNEGVCYANNFKCVMSAQKVSTTTSVGIGNVIISHGGGNVGSTSATLTYTNLTFTSSSGFSWGEDEGGGTSTTVYSINNIKKNDYTYTFPDKSGTIELVDEEKDAKLKHIISSDTDDKAYCAFLSNSNFVDFKSIYNYVKSNKEGVTTTINYNTGYHTINLNVDGDITMTSNNNESITIIGGTVDLTSDYTKAELIKEVCFSLNEAILPNDIKIWGSDNSTLYKLDIDKCVELGILTKVSSDTLSKAKSNINNMFNIE